MNSVNMRRVSFELPPRVHSLCVWSFAYHHARKGIYEQHARDRARFNARIKAMSAIISLILTKSHRERIYYNYHTGRVKLGGVDQPHGLDTMCA